MAERPFFRKVFQMKKTLIRQDKDNKHFQINENIFYFHHLGKNRNPNWERVTICVCNNDEDIAPITFQFDGIGCVEQANQKLQELV
tara:strand:- start:298 stop:555 length:258 start_codon:yes stop_codon:yes gene_type:complete